MNEKLKLSLGVLGSTAFVVILIINIFHPLSRSSATESLHVGSNNLFIDIAVILYSSFIAYAFSSTPHTVNLAGHRVTFTSLIKTRSVPVTEIEALEKINFGFGVLFRSHQGNIRVNSGAVSHSLINRLLTANPQMTLIGL